MGSCLPAIETLTEEELTLPECKYEFLDCTPDVELHAWGDNMKEVFEQCGIAMTRYMSSLSSVDIKMCVEIEIEVTEHDLKIFLWHFLHGLWSMFNFKPLLIFSKLVITEFVTEDDEDMKLKCKCYGEKFTVGKHNRERAMSAIYYPNIRIINEPANNKFEVYIAVDV